MPRDWDQRNEAIRAERDTIVRSAEERHIESLVRELAELLDRAWREAGGGKPAWEIREVQLRGEYPNTVVALRRYDHVAGFETWNSYPVWTELWERPDGGRYAPETIAADILAWALGS
jgi:hypothetical protein